MKVKPGDTVRVHYTGKLDDGSTFDTSQDRDPLEFTLGEGKIIRGFERVVEGMEKGEERTAKIPSDQAYGEHRKDLVFEVERNQFPPDIEPQVGQRLQMTRKDGPAIPVTVAQVDEEMVKLDANHPLAGEDLTFTVRVVEVVSGE